MQLRMTDNWSVESRIEKFDVNPIRSISLRKIRTHMEWKVDTQMSRPCGPTSLDTLSCISLAALLVNVIAKILHGAALRVAIRWAIRCVSTRVLPLPAPAIIRSGPSVASAASFCWGLSLLIACSMSIIVNILSVHSTLPNPPWKGGPQGLALWTPEMGVGDLAEVLC
ncbi:hypothetical protein D3C72_692520 [compost metagenome]